MTTSEPEPDRRPGGRKIGIAVDLREETDHAVRWAVDHYLRPGDTVVLLHVRPTSGLYGADFGSALEEEEEEEEDGTKEEGSRRRMEERAKEIGKPLEEAGLEYAVRIVKDKEMKERVCLEVERLGLSGLVMGRGRRKLGSVSGYCIKHCACPVVVVRDDDDEEEEKLGAVPEEEEEEEAKEEEEEEAKV